MIPAPGVQFVDVHSVVLNDDGDALSLYLELSDGSTVAVALRLNELIAAGHCIEDSTHAPMGLTLQ